MKLSDHAELPASLRAHSSIGRREVPRELLESPSRGRILAGATELFGERGYRHVTVNDLAAAARVSIGTVYRFFGDKKDCLLAAYDHLLAESSQAIALRVPADAPWPERAEAALDGLLDLAAAAPLAARLALTVIQTAGPEGAARQRQTLAETAALLRGGRSCLSRPESLPPSFEEAALAAAAALLVGRLAEGDGSEVRQLLPDLHLLLIAPYLRAAAAPSRASAERIGTACR